MLEEKQKIVNRIRLDFEVAYSYYLLANNLRDDLVVRAGYYATAEMLVSKDPVPDQEVQTEILKILENEKKAAATRCVSEIKLLFMDAAEENLSSAS